MNTGKCRFCSGTYTLTRKGSVKTHYLFTSEGRSKIPCAGSGSLPEKISSRSNGSKAVVPGSIVISGKAQIYAAIQGIDVESLKALHDLYDTAKHEGLRYITSDQLWAQNALVLATKGHYKTAVS